MSPGGGKRAAGEGDVRQAVGCVGGTVMVRGGHFRGGESVWLRAVESRPEDKVGYESMGCVYGVDGGLWDSQVVMRRRSYS